MKLLLVIVAIVIMNGCTPIQGEYKPLYQVKPEIQKIEVK